MNPNVLTAAISASAAVLTAVIALLLNHRTFAMLDSRISDTNRRIDDSNTSISRRIDDHNKRLDTMSQDLREMRTDLKQFFQVQADLDKRLGRIEDKLGIPPR